MVGVGKRMVSQEMREEGAVTPLLWFNLKIHPPLSLAALSP